MNWILPGLTHNRSMNRVHLQMLSETSVCQPPCTHPIKKESCSPNADTFIWVLTPPSSNPPKVKTLLNSEWKSVISCLNLERHFGVIRWKRKWRVDKTVAIWDVAVGMLACMAGRKVPSPSHFITVFARLKDPLCLWKSARFADWSFSFIPGSS